MRTNNKTTTTKTIAHDRISLEKFRNGCNNIPTPTGRIKQTQSAGESKRPASIYSERSFSGHLISNAADANSNSPQTLYPYLKDVLYLKS